MPLNWVFPLHLILTVLSLYTLIGLIANMDGSLVQQRLNGTVPEKLAGGVLAGLGLLFLLRVIVILVHAIASRTSLAEPELAVNVSDFSSAGSCCGIAKRLGMSPGWDCSFKAACCSSR
jgi:hypothetical protein